MNYPLLLDGPTGTELQRRGLELSSPFWSAEALISAPDLLEQIHIDYIEAGADVITANSFRTGRRSVACLAGDGSGGERLTRLAVDIALRARNRSGHSGLLVAGSDAPLEDCYSPDLVPDDKRLRVEHEEHIRWLRDAGCDFVLIETMNSLREGAIACEAASMLDVPVMVSFVTDLAGERTLAGDSLRDVVGSLSPYSPLAILANCSSPRAVLRATEIFAGERERLRAIWQFGGYANGGDPDPIVGWEDVSCVPLADYLLGVREMLELGAGVIGSCCGTTPAHTAALRRMIDGNNQ